MIHFSGAQLFTQPLKSPVRQMLGGREAGVFEQEKLDEARYFLSRMAASDDQPRAFRYELSAFLSAARSVLQYALKQARAKVDGQAWYDTQFTGNAVMKFFRNKRDISIHHQPVVPATSVKIAITEPLHLSVSLSLKVIDSEGKVVRDETTTPEPLPSPEQRPPVCTYRHTFADWKGHEDIMALCSNYLVAIEALVNDGVAKAYLTKPA